MVPTDRNPIKYTEYEGDAIRAVYAYPFAIAALSWIRINHPLLLVYTWYALNHSEFSEPFVGDQAVIAKCLDLGVDQVHQAESMLETLGLLERYGVPPTGGPLFAPTMISREVSSVLTEVSTGRIEVCRIPLPYEVETGRAVDFRERSGVEALGAPPRLFMHDKLQSQTAR